MQITKQELSRSVDVLFNIYLAMAMITLIFGLVLVFWPNLTIAATLLMISLFTGAWGTFLFADAWQSKGRGESWIWQTIGGLLSFGVMIFIFLQPASAVITTTLIIGAWFFFTGIIKILDSVINKHLVQSLFLSILSGAVLIIIGLFFFRHPESALATFISVLGFFQLIAAVIMFLQAFAVKKEVEKELLLKD